MFLSLLTYNSPIFNEQPYDQSSFGTRYTAIPIPGGFRLRVDYPLGRKADTRIAHYFTGRFSYITKVKYKLPLLRLARQIGSIFFGRFFFRSPVFSGFIVPSKVVEPPTLTLFPGRATLRSMKIPPGDCARDTE